MARPRTATDEDILRAAFVAITRLGPARLTLTVKPEDAYGPVDPAAFREVPKEAVPADALKVGTMLLAQGPGGQGVPVRVHEIKEKTVVMDFNHPLAGKTLSFDVKITEIKDAAK